MKKILSIDGGGIRGIIPAMVLAFIEEETGKPISKQFDLVAGTSTGGIIALALTKPRGTRPAWRASDLVQLYEDEGPNIFPRSLWRKATSMLGTIDERYPAGPLEEVLKRYLGETRLAQALKPVIISAYELESRQPFFFKSAKATKDPSYNFLMREAARATSAAPTYFEPMKLKTIGRRTKDKVDYYTLVDGGVFANNPAMCAWAEVSANGKPADACLLSLGTGELTRPLHYEDVKDWGLINWATPILNVVMDGVSDATNYQLTEMLGSKRYLRVTADLSIGMDDMDDVTATNIHALKVLAAQLIDEHGDALLAFSR
jgi:uncharacterized protein